MENEQLKEEIAINDLAVMVQKGFLSVESKIGKLEKNVAEIKTDITEMK